MPQHIKDSVNSTKEFIELWVKFDQIYKNAMEQTAITPEEEKAFLETKSILARKFQILAESLSIDRVTIERTYDVINQILSLKNISTLSEQALRRIENNWHESYISLNRLLGHLEAQKQLVPQEEGLGKKVRRSAMRFLGYCGVIFTFLLIILFLMHILGIFK